MSKPLHISEAKARALRDEAVKCMEANSWQIATPAHLVALYAWCHEQVYGIAPLELKGTEYGLAAQVAKHMLIREFSGKMDDFVNFVHWTWKREEGREKWRVENGREGKRIGWRLQFSPSLLTDFRLSERRTNGAPCQTVA